MRMAYLKCNITFRYIKLNDGWFEFNDSYVSKLSNSYLTDSNTAYVLFYKREGI